MFFFIEYNLSVCYIFYTDSRTHAILKQHLFNSSISTIIIVAKQKSIYKCGHQKIYKPQFIYKSNSMITHTLPPANNSKVYWQSGPSHVCLLKHKRVQGSVKLLLFYTNDNKLAVKLQILFYHYFVFYTLTWLWFYYSITNTPTHCPVTSTYMRNEAGVFSSWWRFIIFGRRMGEQLPLSK